MSVLTHPVHKMKGEAGMVTGVPHALTGLFTFAGLQGILKALGDSLLATISIR